MSLKYKLKEFARETGELSRGITQGLFTLATYERNIREGTYSSDLYEQGKALVPFGIIGMASCVISTIFYFREANIDFQPFISAFKMTSAIVGLPNIASLIYERKIRKPQPPKPKLNKPTNVDPWCELKESETKETDPWVKLESVIQ